jgi:hypothetical protein
MIWKLLGGGIIAVAVMALVTYLVALALTSAIGAL